MCPQFTRRLIIALILSTLPCSAQELAELARKERARRAASGPVRYRIDNIASHGQAGAAASESPREQPADAESRRPSSVASKSPRDTVRDKQLDDLARRGPAVWMEVKKFNQRLADLEKELSELERTGTPTWRRGVRVENPELVRKRREIQTCNRRLQELDQEWRWLQDRARRLGLAPGILRGSR